MKFRLIEKANYLHEPSDWDKIKQLETICKVYYNWNAISPLQLNKIYDKHRGEIGRYNIKQAMKQLDKEAAERKANEDFNDYNANPFNKNEGDCTIRALSLAYGLNYNTVRNELHSLGTKLKRPFNEKQTVLAFIEKHGSKQMFNNQNDEDTNIGTVSNFAAKHSHGTYVLYCTNKPKQNVINSNHLVTILNGEIYDTWDSSDYYVLEAWEINKNANSIANKISDKINK